MNDELMTQVREAFEGFDPVSAMRLAFGKCPHCGESLQQARWVRWCDTRECKVRYIGPLNKALGNQIEILRDSTDEHDLKALAMSMGVDTK